MRHEPVYTDVVTRVRGRFIAQTLGVGDQVLVGDPKPNSLYVLSNDNRSQCQMRNCEADRADISRRGQWEEIERITPSPRAIGLILDKLDLAQLIPRDIRKKLIAPNSGVIVYRIR